MLKLNLKNAADRWFWEIIKVDLAVYGRDPYNTSDRIADTIFSYSEVA